MSTIDRDSRRRMLQGTASATATLAVGSSHAADALKFTPIQTIGPFYPVQKPQDVDADLTRRAGATGAALGETVIVQGRVLDTQGRPVAGAVLEVWQANAAGRYRHPGDTTTAELDPNFDGYAKLVTDERGAYRFRSIKPGPYATGGGGRRTPHIHFDVTGRTTRLITQMYFQDEPLNAQDSVLRGAGAAGSRLIARVERMATGADAGLLVATWDIVLESGRG
jgi:protocatechuate 3,4-dioxygenase beta subunit